MRLKRRPIARCYVLIGLATAFAAIGGCGGPNAESKSDPNDKIYKVRSGDSRMNDAMATARSTVGTFITALASQQSSQDHFTVKVKCVDGDKVEYMWIDPVTYDGKVFHGAIDNTPETVTNIELGQSVTAAPAEVADWMYVDKGVLVGGYTLRVLRDNMSQSERAEFDRSIPYSIK